MSAGDDSKKWIAAQTALALLRGGVGVAEDQAKETLIQSAASGLAATRCRRLRWEPQFADNGQGNQKDDADIPPPFWVEFLTYPDNRKSENWAFGNFSVYSSKRWQSPGYMHTLGVEFAEAEVRALIPPGQQAADAPATAAEPPPAQDGSDLSAGASAAKQPPRSLPPAPASTARSVPAPPSQNDGNGNDITQEEYDEWWEPGRLLRALPASWTLDTKMGTIADLMEDGLIVAVADSIVIPPHPPASLLALPKAIWTGWACLADRHFWDAGKREVFKDHKHYRGPAFRAYRIRLDAKGVSRHLPDAVRGGRPGNAPSVPENVPSASAQPVTAAEVDAWHRALSPEDQALGHTKLWRKARDDHPGRKLVRKLIDPFVKDRPTGRKPKPK
jgi:hypothetical protein